MWALLGSGRFFKQLSHWRILWLGGPFGTGKTLLSVVLGHEMLRRGYVFSVSYPFPVVGSVAPFPLGQYCGLDEGGRVFDSRLFSDKALNRLLSDASVFLRKRFSVLVFASVTPPDKRIRETMRCFRRFGIGSRLWVYRWETGPEPEPGVPVDAVFPKGHIFLVNPGAWFGTFDSRFEPSLEELRGFVTAFGRDPTVEDVAWMKRVYGDAAGL